MNILQRILSEVQSGTTTPPQTQAYVQAMLGQLNPGAAPPTAPQAAPVAAQPQAPAPDPTQGGAMPAALPHPTADGMITPQAAVHAPGAGYPQQAQAAPPQAPQQPGILGQIGHAIGGLLSPQPGSFWSSAMNGGLLNARANMQAYPLSIQKMIDDRRKEAAGVNLTQAQADQAEATAHKDGYIQTPNGNVFAPDGKGGLTPIYTNPGTPGENERMIQMWLSDKKANPGGSPLQDLLARAIKGAQYTGTYLAEKTAGQVAVAHERNQHPWRTGGAGGNNGGVPAGYAPRQ